MLRYHFFDIDTKAHRVLLDRYEYEYEISDVVSIRYHYDIDKFGDIHGAVFSSNRWTAAAKCAGKQDACAHAADEIRLLGRPM